MLLETFQEENEEDLKEEDDNQNINTDTDDESIRTATDDDEIEEETEGKNENEETATNQLPSNLSAMYIIHKGRKYDWQAKLNLHIHIIEHIHLDTIEIIAFNTTNFTETNRVYLSTSSMTEKASDIVTPESIELVNQEYIRLKLHPPKREDILEVIKHNRIAAYILEKFVVTVKATVLIDVKEPKSRVSALPKISSNDKRSTTKGSSNDAPMVSIAQKKPEYLTEATIKRFGKSATLVGDVVGVRVSKEEELLTKIVSNISSPLLASQAKRIISRPSTTTPFGKQGIKRSSSRLDNNSQLRGFHKFKNDTDLLQESLSFLHISDMMILQGVCKKWQQILSILIKSSSSLWMTSRDFHHHNNAAIQVKYKHNRIEAKDDREKALEGMNDNENVDKLQANELLNEEIDSGKIRRTPNIPFNLLQEAKFLVNPLQNFEVRTIFVKSETLLRVLKYSSRALTELRLHYVIISREVIQFMSCLAGKVKKLSIGVIKYNDTMPRPKSSKRAKSVRSYRARSVYSVRSAQSKRPARPAPSEISPRAQRFSNLQLQQHQQPERPLTRGSDLDSEFSDSSDEEKDKNVTPEAPAAYYKFLQFTQLKEILIACGSEITHLELSVTMGELLPEIFKYVPRLQHFSVTDSLMAPIVSCSHDNFDGNVALEEFVQALQGISMLEVLAMVADTESEAFMITDRRGRIVTVNDPFQRMFGFTANEVYGQTVDFLTGSYTKIEEFDTIKDSLKNQLNVEEATVFLYHKHGEPILVQVICVPNIARLKSLPLGYDCLDHDVIGRMVIEEEELNAAGKSPKTNKNNSNSRNNNNTKGKNNWKLQNKELSYHLLRFGYLSDSFAPYQQQDEL